MTALDPEHVVITEPVAGSDYPVHLMYVEVWDGLYAPIGLRKPEGHCELGYWLVPSARRRGLGTEAIRMASDWVLGETDAYRLFAHVVPGNDASRAVLEKCGFVREGVLRSYLRYRWQGIRRAVARPVYRVVASILGESW